MPLTNTAGTPDGKPWQAGVPGGGQPRPEAEDDRKVLLNIGQQGEGKSK